MALYPIVVGGVQIGLIDSNDRFSKDPGGNSAPQAGPNTPVNTGGSKTSQLNFNCSTSGGVTAVLANPG